MMVISLVLLIPLVINMDVNVDVSFAAFPQFRQTQLTNDVTRLLGVVRVRATVMGVVVFAVVVVWVIVAVAVFGVMVVVA